MPVKPTYPGVYIEEIPSGVRTITGVSTSVAAFIDGFRRGVVNEAVQIFSMGDFETEFGGLSKDSAASYGIKQFFLNGGAEAWVVRVGGASASSAVLTEDPGGTGDNIVRVTAGRRIRGESASNPGSWGDTLHVEVDYDTSDPTSLFNLTVSEVKEEKDGRRRTLRTETFRNLTMDTGFTNSAMETVNEGSRLIQLSRDALWPALSAGDRPASTGTLGDEITAAVPASGSTFTVDPGSGAITCTITYTGSIGYPELRGILEDAIRDAAATSGLDESSRALLRGATVRLLGNGSTANRYRFWVLAGRGGASFSPTATLTFGGTAAPTLGLNATPNVQQVKLTGGSDSSSLPDDTELLGTRSAKTGLYALEDVSIFNILCIPRAAELSSNDMRAVYGQAESYCEERRAFLLIDISESVSTLDKMQTWLLQNETLRHRNSAVYFPRPFIPDPLNDNRPKSVGSSGTIAGLYARTDAARGVWKAPAGTDARLRNLHGLAYVLTDPQNGALNPLGVNCLRNFPVYSNVCWGARTLDGADVQASEWKYVPVRRFTLFLEESLYRGTKWAVFEPNDEPLWSQLRLNIGAFTHNLFRQGAFQGTTPRDAYFVKCDSETTTQNDIDQGIVNIVVGFAPLKPAEFVIIKIQQITGEIET